MNAQAHIRDRVAPAAYRRRMDARWARAWFALTAFAVAVELVVTVVLEAQATDRLFDTAAGRVFNVFWFFTIQSNIIVGVTCLLLALDPNRRSTVFATFRLIGIVAITVTMVVFHVVLSRLLDLDTWGQFANQLQHTVVPIMAIVGWVAFGPRGLATKRAVWLSVCFPVAYMAATLIRAPLAKHFYPYPFANVTQLGYARVVINGNWIGTLFVALAAGAAALDARLARAAPTPAPAR